MYKEKQREGNEGDGKKKKLPVKFFFNLFLALTLNLYDIYAQAALSC